MNTNKALWEKGDFTRLAECMRDSGEALVSELGIESGQRLLDLGCGDGTTAVPAAKLGAEVLGVDIASNLVSAGNARAQRSVSPTADSRRAMRRICRNSRTTASIWLSACSEPCSLRGRWTWRASSFES